VEDLGIAKSGSLLVIEDPPGWASDPKSVILDTGRTMGHKLLN